MIRYFAEHPTAANILAIILLLAGVLSIGSLLRETFPDFRPVEASVEVEYRGASAHEVEEAICQRLEDAVDGITDLAEFRCDARENFALAIAKMSGNGDAQRFLSTIATEVDAIDDLPAQAGKPIVRELHRTDLVAALAITGPMDETDLKVYAEKLRERLLRNPHIAQVNLKGFSERQIQVEIAADVLHQHGVSVNAIAAILARQNIELPAGTLESPLGDTVIRFTDERKAPQAFEDIIIIGTADGHELRLGDLATITDTFRLPEVRTELDGTRAAVLEVYKGRDHDSLDVYADLQEFITNERLRAPESVQLVLTQDITSILQDRLQMLTRNGIQGLFLVVAAIWLFFSLRTSLLVGLGLPISFLGAFALMAMLGVSINMVSMVALMLAIGLMMDSAIVIAENIAAHSERGKNPLSAAVEGVREVAPAILSSFLTTAAIFVPLAFISGDIGKVLRVMPFAALLTLIVSLVHAYLILPHHMCHSTRRLQNRTPNRFRQRFEHGFATLRDEYLNRAVHWAVHQRSLFAGLLIFFFLSTIGLLAGGLVKFEAFPDLEGDVVEARLIMPQGTPLERTRQVVEQVVSALEQANAELSPQQPGQQPLVRHILVRYGENTDAFERGPHVATITADLLTAERRSTRLDELFSLWREHTGSPADVLSLNLKEPVIGPAGKALEIRLKGEDLHTLEAAAYDLSQWLKGYTGATDILSDLRTGKPEYHLQLKAGAASLGVDAAEIARQLRAAWLGETVSQIQVGRETFEIMVRQRDRHSLLELERFLVTLPDGTLIPLSEVASMEPARGWGRILRIDRQRTVTVSGDVDTRIANAMEIITDLQKRFLPELQARYPEVQVHFEGQIAESRQTGASMRNALLLGLLGIFCILSYQFRSFIEPAVVMVAIPLAFMGAVWGHLITGYNLSMPSVIGAASLAGIVVNNSILLVAFVKMHASGGATILQAALSASRDRFRALTITTITTALGLMPLMLERSLQAQFLKPLVISIIFGLITSAILVLLAIPCLYSFLDDWRRKPQ